MFFQSIYQMMSAGTDLNINIRRTDGKLSVAVIPRRTTLKDEAGQAIVPLILNGTPMELDGQFLQAVTSPLQRVQEVLVNLETFEKQAQQAASQGKAARSASSKETKETRELWAEKACQNTQEKHDCNWNCAGADDHYTDRKWNVT